MHWFDQEYKQRLEEATDMPTCGDYEDYLRKGIPFLTGLRVSKDASSSRCKE